MKRVILIICALLSVTLITAQQTPREWIDMLNKTLSNRYGTHIRVDVDAEEEVTGYFMVEGDSYYILLGVMEVYSDGKLRYEINNERKEVTEDVVNLEAVDLLTNPTRAFSFVDSEYDATINSVLESGVEIKLVPKVDDMGVSAIYLTLKRDGAKVVPQSIAYDYDGDKVFIELTMADISESKLPRWNKNDYRAYDIVSFL